MGIWAVLGAAELNTLSITIEKMSFFGTISGLFNVFRVCVFSINNVSGLILSIMNVLCWSNFAFFSYIFTFFRYPVW